MTNEQLGQPEEPRSEPEQLSGQPQTAEAARTKSTPETEPQLHPSIWIGSLLDYNYGILHGEWVEAAREANELLAEARRILASSPTAAETGDVAEEWAILDFEDFGDFHVGEHDDLTVVAEVARGIARYGGAFAAWAELHDADEGMLAHFEDAYLGAHDSVEAWAEQVVETWASRSSLTGRCPRASHATSGSTSARGPVMPNWVGTCSSVRGRMAGCGCSMRGDEKWEPDSAAMTTDGLSA